MTDMTPGSRWLLPVTYMLTSSRYGMEFDTASDTTTISWEDCESLIPADRITELEAEAARWRRLYDDASAANSDMQKRNLEQMVKDQPKCP